jgi:hypothetical protein
LGPTEVPRRFGGLRLVAVVVALGDDFAVFVMQEGGEVGAHLAAYAHALKGDGEGAAPIDFKGDLIAAANGEISDELGMGFSRGVDR